MPHAVVIRAPGTNCDQELCRGYVFAGASVELVHLESLVKNPAPLAKADLLGIPGGFSYGDDIASGRIFAMKVRERLYAPLRDALARGVPVFAPCNGFQVAVQVGILPGPVGSDWPADAAPAQEVALTDNIGGRFVDRWVPVEFPPDAACIWTRGVLDHIPDDFKRDAAMLPVAHGEGRFVTASAAVMGRLRDAGQIAVKYLDNYNGSAEAVAGISDMSGRVFGLMPHPERFLEWTRHPYWTRLPKDLLKLPTPGAKMFTNAVEAASAAWVR
jgi:phosphoribosylformylglycinamidine synthase